MLNHSSLITASLLKGDTGATAITAYSVASLSGGRDGSGILGVNNSFRDSEHSEETGSGDSHNNPSNKNFQPNTKASAFTSQVTVQDKDIMAAGRSPMNIQQSVPV